MPVTTVTPNFVNAPKAESNYGSIKVGDRYYGFDVRKIRTQEFNKGEAVTIDYSESDRNGKTYYNISRIVREETHAPANNGNHQPSAASQRDETITRLAIAKSCIEGGKTMADADAWIRWVKDEPRV